MTKYTYRHCAVMKSPANGVLTVAMEREREREGGEREGGRKGEREGGTADVPSLSLVL